MCFLYPCGYTHVYECSGHCPKCYKNMHLNMVQEDACTQGKFIASSWPGKKWHLVEGVKGNVDMRNVSSCQRGYVCWKGRLGWGQNHLQEGGSVGTDGSRILTGRVSKVVWHLWTRAWDVESTGRRMNALEKQMAVTIWGLGFYGPSRGVQGSPGFLQSSEWKNLSFRVSLEAACEALCVLGRTSFWGDDGRPGKKWWSLRLRKDSGSQRWGAGRMTSKTRVTWYWGPWWSNRIKRPLRWSSDITRCLQAGLLVTQSILVDKMLNEQICLISDAFSKN